MDDTRACSNVDVVDRFLDLLTAHDIAAATAMFTEDAELVAPYSPPPLPPGGQGREAVGMLFSMIFGGYGRAEFLDRRIVATADPDVVELRDGRITRFTEYFNPEALRAAGVI